jgi:hypothetical protein
MENIMFKKNILLGILLMTVALTNMAFISVSYQPRINRLASIADTNFRFAHVWNSIYIPSMDVTGLLTLPVADSSSIADTNFRFAHVWNGIYIPSMDVTGYLTLPAADNPSIAATGFASPAVIRLQPHIKLNSGH